MSSLRIRRRVFCSLDYDNDKDYRNLLRAWNANPEFEFTWNETSPRVAIDSKDADTIKAALARMIGDATHFLCIVGKSTYRSSWVQWEIAFAISLRNKLVAVKTDRENISPTGLLNANASWAMAFTQDAILRALRDA
jgi:hypothetical protein